MVVISFMSMAALGYLIGSFFKSARTAQVVGNIVFFPQIFLSGAGLPREIFSQTLRDWTEWLPMTQVTLVIREAWWGDPISGWSMAYLIGFGVIAAAISVRVFKWE